MKKLSLALVLLCGLSELSTSLASDKKANPLVADDQTLTLWNFSEGEGTVYHDSGAAGLDLKPSTWGESTDAPQWVEGQFGPALHFAGSSVLVPAVSRPPLELEDEVTVEAWIRLPSEEPQLGMGLVQYGKPGTDGFRFAVETTGDLLWIVSAGGKENAIRSRTKLPLDEWIHVAGTYDGRDMKLYVNGELDNEAAVEGGQLQNLGNLTIGHFGGGARPDFIGDIQAIRISKSARTDFGH